MRIFISHSSKEAEIAGLLCNAIEKTENCCFIAPRDIRLGYEYAEEIANGIDNADALLLLLSEASNASPHVIREIERAVSKGLPIFVYKLEGVRLTKSMEYFLMTRQWMEAGKDSYEDVAACINRFKDEPEGIVGTKPGAVHKNTYGKKHRTKTPAYLRIVLPILAVAVCLTVIILFCAGRKDNETRDWAADNISPGDTIVMGNYNGQDMYWRVIKISEDGREAVLVSRDVICVKAFDAPDSGQYNHDGVTNYYFEEDKLTKDFSLQAYVKGNSSWKDSTIRTWLNSDRENVIYEGQAPVSEAMAEGVNGYSGEKGFLCSFNKEERKRIIETKVLTKGNALAAEETVETYDSVFLLSMEELAWLTEADVSLLSVPTEAAVRNNKTHWYEDYCLDYGIDAIMWWLREPVEDSSSMCYLVGNGYKTDNIYQWETGVESFGIRPAVTIDLTVGEVKVQ